MGRNYEQGVTMALAEAYAMSEDSRLRAPLQKALQVLQDRQAPSGGWNYTSANEGRHDSSVTGWCLMALKSAKAADMPVGDSWSRGKNGCKVLGNQ